MKALGTVQETALWRWLGLGLVLLGLLLRVRVLGEGGSLHMDEALYASVGRHALERGDLFFNGIRTDKPPWVFWMLALSQGLIGTVDTAARASGLLAYGVGVWAVIRWLAPAWGWASATAALGFWALSPLSWIFGTTALTEPWLLAWTLAGLCAIFARRDAAAGVCLGLALASKQTGLLSLAVAVCLLRLSDPAWRARTVEMLRRYAWVAGILLAHSLLFANPRFGAYFRPAAGAEGAWRRFQPEAASLAPRMEFWAAWLGWSGAGVISSLLVAVALIAGLRWRSPWRGPAWGLAAMMAAFLGLLTLGGSPLFGRYLAWLVPLLALALAAAAWDRVGRGLVLLALGGLVLGSLWHVRAWDWPRDGALMQTVPGWRELGRWYALRSDSPAGDESLVLGGRLAAEGWTAGYYLRRGRQGPRVASAPAPGSWRQAAGPGILVLQRGEDPSLEDAVPPLWVGPGLDGQALLAWQLPLKGL
jgi:4-amino-4-deoxy-L-arabinose transferase-like glycosyltransferase